MKKAQGFQADKDLHSMYESSLVNQKHVSKLFQCEDKTWIALVCFLKECKRFFPKIPLVTLSCVCIHNFEESKETNQTTT